MPSAVNLNPSAGSFEWLAWANLYYWGNCGLGALNLNNGLGNANWNILAGACDDTINSIALALAMPDIAP